MGYAIHLLREVEKIAKNTGVNKIALQVEDENTIALGFYEKNNYVEIDPQASYTFSRIKRWWQLFINAQRFRLILRKFEIELIRFGTAKGGSMQGPRYVVREQLMKCDDLGKLL